MYPVKIITVEDASIVGGLGSAVVEYMNDNSYKAKVSLDEMLTKNAMMDYAQMATGEKRSGSMAW